MLIPLGDITWENTTSWLMPSYFKLSPTCSIPTKISRKTMSCYSVPRVAQMTQCSESLG